MSRGRDCDFVNLLANMMNYISHPATQDRLTEDSESRERDYILDLWYRIQIETVQGEALKLRKVLAEYLKTRPRIE